MTTTAIVPVPARARNVLASEWIKLRSVRSTYLTLLVAAVAAIGVGYLVTHSDATHWASMSAAARAAFDPVGDSFAGLGIAQLAFGALGVLAISSEYATGLIRTTFASVPRRRAVIAAKAAVAGVISLLAGELIAFATFFTTQQALSAQHLNVTRADPGALRGVLAAGFYLAVMTWVGLGLGPMRTQSAGSDRGAVQGIGQESGCGEGHLVVAVDFDDGAVVQAAAHPWVPEARRHRLVLGEGQESGGKLRVHGTAELHRFEYRTVLVGDQAVVAFAGQRLAGGMDKFWRHSSQGIGMARVTMPPPSGPKCMEYGGSDHHPPQARP